MRVVLCKKRIEKHQIFEKWENFENGPSCKGYRPCNMLRLGQKLKIPKTYEKSFYKNVRVVRSVQKTARKNTKYSRNETFQNRSSCNDFSPCKAYSLCKILSLGQKLTETPKICEKPFYKNIGFVLCKKPVEKTPNIPEMRQFSKSAILQRL